MESQEENMVVPDQGMDGFSVLDEVMWNHGAPVIN